MAKYSQVERNGLFELSDEARAELASSKYYNEDLAPTTLAQRTWTTYNITMLWVGMSICVPSLTLATSLVQMGVNPWLAVVNVALGNILILVPIQLNSQIGCKYGIPFPGFARLTFGNIGAQIPALSRAIVACGWTSVQCWVGGGAVAAMIGCFAGGFNNPNWHINLPTWTGMVETSCPTFIGYIIFLIFIAWVAYNGIENIKWVQNIGGPVLVILMICLCIWSVRLSGEAGTTVGAVMGTPSSIHGSEFGITYMIGLMGNIAFWATMALNIPDFSRYARSQKDQFAGQLIGMPIPMAFCAFVGALYAQSAIVFNDAKGLAEGDAGYYSPYDVVSVLYNIPSKAVVFIVSLGVVMATVTTCAAANIVAPANGFSNLAPKKISYKKGVIITILLAFFVLQAWWIYGGAVNFFGWLNVYGTILAPLAAIFIADYFFVKKRRIDVAGLFADKGGRYWYSGGFNVAAMIAWVASFILPVIAVVGGGNLTGGFWTFMNATGYITAFVIGFIVYVILMKIPSFAKDSFVTEEEHEAFTKRG